MGTGHHPLTVGTGKEAQTWRRENVLGMAVLRGFFVVVCLFYFIFLPPRRGRGVGARGEERTWMRSLVVEGGWLGSLWAACAEDVDVFCEFSWS